MRNLATIARGSFHRLATVYRASPLAENRAPLAQDSLQQMVQARTRLVTHGCELDPHTLAWLRVPHHRLCSNLAVGHFEKQFDDFAYWRRLRSGNKQAAQPERAHSRDDPVATRLPGHQHSFWQANAGIPSRFRVCAHVRIHNTGRTRDNLSRN